MSEQNARPAERFGTVLEIRRQDDGSVPAALIAAAFRASQTAAVMLVLESVSPGEVDRVLDTVVSGSDLAVPGVRYADVRDDAVVLPVAAQAGRIFAGSAGFRRNLDAHGIAHLDVTEFPRARPAGE